MLGFVRSRIKDSSLVTLISKFLRAGYIHFPRLVDSRFTLKFQKTDPGFVLSSLLINLYFHELDLFIQSNFLLYTLQMIVNNSRFYYLRYVDNFVVGFSGPKFQVMKIMQSIIHYLYIYLHITVNVNKTYVVHYLQGVSFLGYKIECDFCLYFKTFNFSNKVYL